jgi:heterodisulfide reductase subunit A2
MNVEIAAIFKDIATHMERQELGKSIIILGGGIAGLAVAKHLAGNGLPCTIVEKQDKLGGRVRHWACMATDHCLRCFCCTLEDLLDEVSGMPHVRVLTGTELSSAVVSEKRLRQVGLKAIGNGAETIVETEALVIATGFEPYDPSEKLFWGYGSLNGVYTLAELDAFVRNDDLAAFAGTTQEPLKIAFFQCVGSRDNSIGAAYCSQYCCKAALRMALRLLKDRPEWHISLFYIDLQIADRFAPTLLAEARERGIRLIQGVPGEVLPGSENTLEIIREEAGRNVRETFHKVVLSVGQRPSSATARIASLVGLDMNDFGFLSPKGHLDGSRSTVKGVYLAGTCTGPKDIEETLIDCGRTASTVISELSGANGA